MGGLEALPRIREVAPESRILVSTGYDNTMRKQAMDLGAHGLIVKGATASEIATAIRRVWKDDEESGG
jgi:DNA-binding NarL/FixJ family response regulator